MIVGWSKRSEQLQQRINDIYMGESSARKGTPCCVFIPFLSGGDVMFGFKAPSKGATIITPAISVESLSGELVMSGFVGNQTLKPVPLQPGNMTLDSDINLNPFDEIQISVSGSGTARNIWITYYCA